MPASKASLEMLDDLVTNNVADLEELRLRHNLTVKQMARWVCGRRVRKSLDAIRHYRRKRASVLITSARLVAIERLLDMCKPKRRGEVARRSCVDLLRLSHDLRHRPDATRSAPDTSRTDDQPWESDSDDPHAAARRELFQHGVRSLLEAIGSGKQPKVIATRPKAIARNRK